MVIFLKPFRKTTTIRKVIYRHRFTLINTVKKKKMSFLPIIIGNWESFPRHPERTRRIDTDSHRISFSGYIYLNYISFSSKILSLNSAAFSKSKSAAAFFISTVNSSIIFSFESIFIYALKSICSVFLP